MMLKRLTLVGFKSFADKTTFDFDRGITCVVGPNGCGKSNIVDAIKWVLGEQSAKSLRGSQMQDVIFNGSGTRKPAGMAQVELVFDNSAGRLGIDAKEVTVSRRLFRDGTSEYLINGQVVRLKDLRELFLGTGIGGDAYCIIEQGRIEVLLQANPQQRRAIFDEAAGISKYRVRVKECLRKLERTEQNLLRVCDIIEELERRLRSVKVQAGRARSWQEYTARLRELRSLYVLNEYRNLDGQLQQRREQLERRREEGTALHSAIGACEADAAQIDAHIVQLDARIGAAESDLQIAASRVQAQRERIAQTYQRMLEGQEAVQEARKRALACKARQRDLCHQVEVLGRDLAGLDEAIGAVQREIEAAQAEDRSAAATVSDVSGGLEEAKAQLLELVRNISHLRSEQVRAEDQAKSLTAQRTRLLERLESVRGQIESLQEKCDATARHLEQLRERQAEVDSLLKELQEQTAALDRRKADLAAELGTLKQRRSGLESRLQVLEELNRRYEGVAPGVRALLDRRDEAAAEGRQCEIIGLLGELIEVDLQDAGWIEAALAGLDEVLIVESLEGLLAEADRWQGVPGRVKVLALDAVETNGAGEIDLAGEAGFVGWAVQRVRFEHRYEPAVRWALERTGLTETLQDAVRLAAKAPRGYRFVSRDGQVVESAGPLVLGKGKAGTGLISRRSEQRRIEQDLQRLEEQIVEMEATLAATSAEFETLLAKSDEHRAGLQELQKVTVQAESQLQAERENLGRLRQEAQLLEAETALLSEQIREATLRAADLAEQVETLEGRQSSLQSDIESREAQLAAAVATRAQIQERLTQIRVEAGKLAEKRAGVLAALQQAERDLHRAQQEQQDALAALDLARDRVMDAERSGLAAQQALAEACQEKEHLQAAALSLRKQRAECRAELEQLQGRLRSLRQEYEAHEAALRELEVQTSQLQLQLDTLVARTAEELQVDLVALARSAEQQTEQIDWDRVAAEIAELRGKIDRLGHVNLEAIHEQSELEERLSFLTSQRDDLQGSKRQLEGLIERLNEESRRRFVERFEQIRVHFQELFRKLFGGGRADVVLTDPDDVLESGVEVVARPPGKDLQSISLLSGGEKALAAVALLLAVFKSNPGPFAILDEADAALDEANNDRFVRLIREFLEHSQFIIITHSKRTMSAADVMYGVTMQEAGVSKRVSVRFSDESAQMQQVA